MTECNHSQLVFERDRKMQHPGRESMMRAASLAGLRCEDWMQDWPIEVATGDRLVDFIGLLEAHRNDWELTFWFLDLVLESARERADLVAFKAVLLEAIHRAVAATHSPSVIHRLEYWACLDSPLDEAFEVSPIVREALRNLA
jgi:hypothetical protein